MDSEAETKSEDNGWGLADVGLVREKDATWCKSAY